MRLARYVVPSRPGRPEAPAQRVRRARLRRLLAGRDRLPALQARVREFIQDLEEQLATLFATADGTGPDTLRARFAAAATIAAYRTVYLRAAQRVITGEDPARVSETLPTVYAQAFDGVERALAEIGDRQ